MVLWCLTVFGKICEDCYEKYNDTIDRGILADDPAPGFVRSALSVTGSGIAGSVPVNAAN